MRGEARSFHRRRRSRSSCLGGIGDTTEAMATAEDVAPTPPGAVASPRRRRRPAGQGVMTRTRRTDGAPGPTNLCQRGRARPTTDRARRQLAALTDHASGSGMAADATASSSSIRRSGGDVEVTRRVDVEAVRRPSARRSTRSVVHWLIGRLANRLASRVVILRRTYFKTCDHASAGQDVHRRPKSSLKHELRLLYPK